MGGISLGTGIFSGIDTRSLIEQLLSIESRPKQLAQRRLIGLQSQQAALMDMNSAIFGLREASAAFRRDLVFKASRATSSQPEALTATAGANATPGSYNFTVSRLVSTEQQISRGFADKDVSGLGATEFTFEVGGGRVDRDTRLSDLNGGAGAERGRIRITDSAGGVAIVDLSTAVTVNDVLDAINSQTDIGVTASVEGGRFVITDNAAGVGTLQVDNMFGSATASSLGVAKSAVDGVLTGDNVYSLGQNTPLSVLNDALGVAYGRGGLAAPPDFSILVEDAGGGNAVTHTVVLGELGENVTDPETGEITYQATSPPVVTLADLFARIEQQTGGAVTGAINAQGTGIVLETANPARQLTVQEGALRETAAELGLLTGTGQSVESRRLFGGVNTVLLSTLNGGAGVTPGTIQIQQRSGATFTVDVAAEDTLDDVLRKITQGGANITATVSGAGNGVRITDATTGGDLIITDLSGAAAADLGVATAGAANGVVDSGNLQAKWIGRATRLDSLNAGAGVGTGQIRLTDSTGATSVMTVDASIVTVDQLVRAINARPTGIVAEVNDNGDGVVLRDTAGGSNAMKVEDVDAGVARNLRIAGQAKWSTGDPAQDNVIDGSYERRVEFTASDTLQQIADKINNASVGVSASIISDGAGATPFRLILTSRTSGKIGRFVTDTQGFDLAPRTLTQGRDAVVFFGSADPAEGVMLTSSRNTLDKVIQGVTIDLNATTQSSVEVVVSRDVNSIEEAMGGFVEAYNTVIDRLRFHTRFNPDTQEKGILLGDSTVSNIQAALQRTLQAKPIGVESSFDVLVQVGVRIGEGGKINFDRDRFRQAYEDDPQGLEEMIAGFGLAEPVDEEIQPGVTVRPSADTFTKQGVMEQFRLLATGFTNSIDGVLTRRRETLDNQIRLQQQRILQFDSQLDSKRLRLERQFAAMEDAIARLSSQQAAVASIGGQLG